MPPIQRDAVKEQFWREKIAKFKASSYPTKSAFCDAEGLKVSSFCGWETIIRRRDAERSEKKRKENRAARRQQGDARSRSAQPNSKHNPSREAFWRNALARFAASGMSDTQFCIQEGFYQPTFDYWKSVMLEQDGALPSTSGKPRQTFLPLVVSDGRSADRAERKPVAEILFAGGSILVFDGIDVKTVVSLLKAVREVD